MIALKVCGMRDCHNISVIAALAPQYIGFICWPGSPRFVGEEFSLETCSQKLVGIMRVGIFVNQSLDEIEQWITNLALDVVQLHGDEEPEFCQELKQRSSIRELWKAFSVAEDFPAEDIRSYQGLVDRILFDTKDEKRGGTGKRFAWELLRQYQGETPVVLSGGLNLENLPEAQELIRHIPQISVLDFNSGLESAIAVKDAHRVVKVIDTLSRWP